MKIRNIVNPQASKLVAQLLRELEDEMQSASANLEFERAALLPVQIMEVKAGTGLTKV